MDAREIFKRPNLFLLAFEPAHGVFVEMNREAYHRSIFFDMRIAPVKKDGLKIPLAPLIELQEREFSEIRPISYIFHVAHCGSTLLARALDEPGENLVVREPMPLRQLAVEAGSGFYGAPAPDAWKKRLDLACALLGRSYTPNGPVIVKGNVPVNFIAKQLVDRSPGQPSILLYFPFEHYLLAILRSPNHRKWVGSVIGELQRGVSAHAPLAAGMSVAQGAAALWLAQMRIYADILATHPKAASLDAEVFFNHPREAVAASFRHFGMSCPDERLDAIIGGELFARYSKNPSVAFDNSARLARRDALKKEMAGELDEARNYVLRALESEPLPAKLANPLTGESPDLLMRI